MNRNTCDCCYEQTDNIQSCYYKHNLCLICINRFEGKCCMFCNPFEKTNNTNINYYENERYQKFYFILTLCIIITFYLDGLFWIFYNYIFNILVYHYIPYNVGYWYLPSIKQCILSLITNSIIVILFSKECPIHIYISIPIFGAFS